MWEAGHRTAKSMLRRGGIPLRSAERYISLLKNGDSLERKVNKSRKKFVETPHIVKKVIRKVENKKVVPSLRKIALSTGISHTSTKSILN